MTSTAKKFTLGLAMASLLTVGASGESRAANELVGGLLGGGAGAGIGGAISGAKGAAIGGVLGLALGAFAANQHAKGNFSRWFGNDQPTAQPAPSYTYAPQYANAPAPTYAPAPARTYTPASATYVPARYSDPATTTYAPAPRYAYAAPVAQQGEIVRAVQSELSALGYNPGPIDGINGRRTSAAIRKYQADHSFITDGRASLGLLDHVRITRSRQAANQGQPIDVTDATSRYAPPAPAYAYN